MRHRFTESRAQAHRLPTPRTIGYAVSFSTAVALAEDAEWHGDSKLAGEWMDVALEIEERETSERKRKHGAERERTKRDLLHHARRYGL